MPLGRLRDPNAGSLFPVAGEFGELGLLPELEFELPAALQLLFLLGGNSIGLKNYPKNRPKYCPRIKLNRIPVETASRAIERLHGM